MALQQQVEDAQAYIDEEDVGAGKGLARAAPAPPAIGRQTTADLIQQAIDLSLGGYEAAEGAGVGDPAVQAARARRQAAREAIAERLLDSASFGPFGLVPLASAALGLVVNPDGLTFSIDTSVDDLRRGAHRARRVRLWRALAARAAVCGLAKGDVLGLLAAQYVQYAYPLVGMHDCAYAEELDMARPANNLAALGGFLYYDGVDAKQPCMVHAFIGDAAAAEVGFDAGQVAGALSFAGPFSLEPLEIGERLWEGGRVHDIVDDAVARRGVRKFGWIAPGEAIRVRRTRVARCSPTAASGRTAPLSSNTTTGCSTVTLRCSCRHLRRTPAAAAVPPTAQEEGLDALSDELRELRAHVAAAEGNAAGARAAARRGARPLRRARAAP